MTMSHIYVFKIQELKESVGKYGLSGEVYRKIYSYSDPYQIMTIPNWWVTYISFNYIRVNLPQSQS